MSKARPLTVSRLIHISLRRRTLKLKGSDCGKPVTDYPHSDRRAFSEHGYPSTKESITVMFNVPSLLIEVDTSEAILRVSSR